MEPDEALERLIRVSPELAEGTPDSTWAVQSETQIIPRYWEQRSLERAPDLSPAFEVLRRALRDSVLVDLGCGRAPERMRAVAKRMGCRAYIGVDAFVFSKQYARHVDQDGFVYADVSANLLRYIPLLRDQRCSVAMNGIDYCVVPEESFHREVASALTDAISVGAVVFGANSEALKHLAAPHWKTHAPFVYERLNDPGG